VDVSRKDKETLELHVLDILGKSQLFIFSVTQQCFEGAVSLFKALILVLEALLLKL